MYAVFVCKFAESNRPSVDSNISPKLSKAEKMKPEVVLFEF